MEIVKRLLSVGLVAAALASSACSRTEAAADNTKRNERDRTGETLTPLDQGENESDRAISQEVRQGIVKDDSLSMTAKNVKIITVGGVVTLRGPVKSAEEKAALERIAKRSDHVSRVDNQLEIASN